MVVKVGTSIASRASNCTQKRGTLVMDRKHKETQRILFQDEVTFCAVDHDVGRRHRILTSFERADALNPELEQVRRYNSKQASNRAAQIPSGSPSLANRPRKRRSNCHMVVNKSSSLSLNPLTRMAKPPSLEERELPNSHTLARYAVSVRASDTRYTKTARQASWRGVFATSQ